MALFAVQLQLLNLLSLFLLPILISIVYQRSKPKLPPGPRGLPIIGNLHQLGKRPHHSLRRLALQHGPFMYLQLGRVPTLIVSSAAAAAEVLKSHDLALCSRPPIIALQKFSYGGSDIAFSTYNESWRQAKKLAVVELFNSGRVHSYRSVREEEVGVLVRTITQSHRSPVNLGEMAICLFNNITFRVLFGRRISKDGECRRSEYQELLVEMIRLMGGFYAGDFFPGMEWMNVLTGSQARLDRNFDMLDELLEREIEGHARVVEGPESEPETQMEKQHDFCSILLRLRKDPKLAELLTKTYIKGLLMDVFLGGTETTAAALQWAMAELVQNPRVMKRAQAEIREVVGNKTAVDETDLPKLCYLKLVMKEVLRLQPAGLISRECRKECEIYGYKIPVKTTIYVNSYAIGRDPKVWENPESFCPERFENISLDYKGQHFDYLPFGSGRRMCPGVSMATVGMEIALANLLYHFNWELPEGKDEVDMEECFGLAIHMKTHLILKAIPASVCCQRMTELSAF